VIWRAILCLAVLAVAACGSRVGSGGPADLRGRTYLSTAVTEDGKPKPLVPGTQIQLGFSADGARVSAYAGCNHMGGTARIDNGRLVVSDLAQTLIGCDGGRDAQDGWLAKVLTDGPTLRVDGSELVVVRGTTEIRLVDRKVADPDRPLVGTRWVVDTVIDGGVASSVPQGAVAELTINADGAFRGNAGCNQMGGTAVATAATIGFSNVFTTKMACEPDRMALENAVLRVLRGDVTYRIDADALQLTHPSGAGLALRAR
jgi:heat shock protein HslJ